MFRTQVLRQSIKSCFSRIPRSSSLDVKSFRESYFDNKLPVHFTGQFDQSTVPAIGKWFETSPHGPRLNAGYLQPHANSPVSLERTTAGSGQNETSFERFEAPFSVFIDWCNSQVEDNKNSNNQTKLYLAQQPLTSLPPTLQQNLPTPELVSAGKGDIYASSIWLGISPTSTPMHKDPNPNLFVQMMGTKRIRMIKPVDGRMLLSLAREEIQEHFWQVHTYAGLDGMRGEEMMGIEGRITERFMWECDVDVKDGEEGVLRGFEASLQPGDGLFIPQGWWHSVRGTGVGLNASVSGKFVSTQLQLTIVQVNWWFR